MAINSVSSAKKEDAWDKVAKALTIANQGLGIAANVQSIRKSENEIDKLNTADERAKAAEDRIAKGIITPDKQLEYAAKYDVSPTKTEGSFPLQTTRGDTFYYAPKKDSVSNPGLVTPDKLGTLLNGGAQLVPEGTKGAVPMTVPTADGATKTYFVKGAEREGPQPKPDQFKVAQFGQRMQQAEDVFGKLSEEGYSPTTAASSAQRLSWVPNVVKSKQVQEQEQAERNFINAVLRRESGAAISKEEFSNAEKQYFPRYGDSPEVQEQKAKNRALVINGFKQEAGDAWAKVSPTANNPMSGPKGPASVGTGQKPVGLTPAEEARRQELLKKANAK